MQVLPLQMNLQLLIRIVVIKKIVKAENKINRHLFDVLNMSIKHPFVVMDESGNILSSNEEAKLLFSLEGEGDNFFNLLDESSAEKIAPLFNKLTEAKKPIVKEMQFILNTGDEINCELTLNAYRETDDSFIFCSFKIKENKIKLRGVTKIQGITTNFKGVIKNGKILEIFEDIKSLYPFTFIGKEKIRKEIDALDEYFWVKDNKGSYIIINNKFSRSLGLKTTQIEGKNENNFIPQYLINFRNSIDEYLNESLNCVILQGVPLKGMSADDDYQTIEVPLSDADDKVVAVMGIAQKITDAQKTNDINLFESLEKSIKYFSGLFLFTDVKGAVKIVSPGFKALFEGSQYKLEEKQIEELFPGKIASALRDFFISGSENNLLDSSESANIGGRKFNGLQIKIDRLFSDEKKLIGFSFFVDDKNAAFNLDQLITGRGRMFEVLIQNNPEPILIYDKDNLRFLEVNSAALSLYGYNREEFLQMDLTDLYTPDDIQTLLDSSNTKIKEGKFSGPFKHRKKDGSSVFVEISKVSFQFHEKSAHFNIIRNVSEKLELAKKTQLFKASFDNLSDIQFVTDASGFIQLSNLQAIKILGYSKSDFDNASFVSFFTDDERGNINNSIFNSHLKETVKISSTMKNKDGSIIEVEVTATPVVDYKEEIDSFNILVKPSVNTSEVKEIIKEVIVEKPAEYKPAVGVQQNNSAFLSSTFHELLTPINVILGFVQELTEGVQNLSPDQKEAADIINQNRLNLLNTMNSVIELAAIERNDYEVAKAETSITTVLDDLSHELEDLSSIRDVEFAFGKISSSLKFSTDKQKFVNLLAQIVRIVARLSKERKIYFSAFPYHGDSFIVSIKDGYNVSTGYLIDQLTQLFSNEETSAKKDFGISKLIQRLAKALLVILNGRFEIFYNDSKKRDCGFVFPVHLEQIEIKEVELPEQPEIKDAPKFSSEPEVIFKEHKPLISEARHTEAEKEEEIKPVAAEENRYKKDQQILQQSDEYDTTAGSHEQKEKISETNTFAEPEPEHFTVEDYIPKKKELVLSQLNCLYIEDQVDSQILFKVQMKELNAIKFAVSFEEALPLLDSHTFDFIVMDINLQGEYNGLDALKIIKKMPAYQNIPIIAVTAYVLPGDKEKFIATGFSDFISKPIFREKLIDSLEKIFMMR